MILSSILEKKNKEVEYLKKYYNNQNLIEVIELLLKQKKISFYQSLKKKPFSIIAECKKASPSMGILRKEYNPVEIAKIYEQLGASAISVLTDSDFFMGSISDLKNVKKCVSIPVLRKDFIISKEQILEAKLQGADAVLLIVRILSSSLLQELIEYCNLLDLDYLIEVHTEKEIELALKYPIKILGINHRDLDTLQMNMDLTLKLAPQIKKTHPDILLIAESGIENPDMIFQLSSIVNGFLIGTYFMKSTNIQEAWNTLLSKVSFS